MRNIVKKFLRGIIPVFLYNYLLKKQNLKHLKKWKKKGRPYPIPHILKENVIGEYQQKTSFSILIETGTLRGNMIEAQKKRFKKIISIEINNILFKKAKARFRRNRNVEVLNGDSSKVLPKILADLKEPVIFYIDAHYVEGISEKSLKTTPIIEELEAILSSRPFNHVILIDDANYFDGKHDGYPNIKELTQIVENRRSNYSLKVEYDIIRIEIFDNE
jgi:hypothetical protein